MNMKQGKKRYGSPLFRFRLEQEFYDWLRDYAKRNNKTMSGVIKEHLETLRQGDLKERKGKKS